MMKKKVLSANQRNPSHGSRSTNGPCQPPKNSVVSSADTNTMPTYSPTKNIPNFMPEYSVWITRRQLLFGLRHVERKTVSGGDRGQRESAEPEELRNDEPQVPLRRHDPVELERARLDHYSHQGDAHEDFIAHHLRRRTQAAQQRILAVARPATEHHRINRQPRGARKTTAPRC